MTHVATLISNPAKPALDADALDRVRAALGTSLAVAGQPKWLDPGIAADIPFTPADTFDQRGLAAKLRAELAGRPIDVVVQAQAHRRKRLFLADMDSTMIGQECIDELADHAGLKAHVAAITERAMRGEIEFEPALRERLALLKGLPQSVVDEVIENRIVLTSGGRTLIATMRVHGTYTCLVSGGFTAFTGRIGAMLGFDEDRSNTLVLGTDGRLTGLVAEPILGREAKLATLNELRQRFGLAREDTMAIGDGANDIPMIEAAGLGVAYHGKPAVAQAASARIDHGDLTALLYAQDYARSEFSEHP
jgi:phosphoserine phosphatase